MEIFYQNKFKTITDLPFGDFPHYIYYVAFLFGNFKSFIEYVTEVENIFI